MKKFLFAAVILALSAVACNNRHGTDKSSQADSDSSVYNAMPQADTTSANPEPGDTVTNNAKGTSN